VEITSDGSGEISGRSRGTPRVANRLLRRVRDFAQVRAGGVITKEVASSALDMLEIDSKGFDKMDRRLLLTIIDKYSGGPVGIDSLAAALHEERDAIEDLYEPYLIQEGYMMRTPRGRVATELAYKHLGRTPGKGANGGQERLCKAYQEVIRFTSETTLTPTHSGMLLWPPPAYSSISAAARAR
jgi:Holliday junction DNA helicase RuvB